MSPYVSNISLENRTLRKSLRPPVSLSPMHPLPPHPHGNPALNFYFSLPRFPLYFTTYLCMYVVS